MVGPQKLHIDFQSSVIIQTRNTRNKQLNQNLCMAYSEPTSSTANNGKATYNKSTETWMRTHINKMSEGTISAFGNV